MIKQFSNITVSILKTKQNEADRCTWIKKMTLDFETSSY